MKITLRQLEIFAAIAIHGQVTSAAESVAMTQSAASMALGDLERQLDIRLFDRFGRQLILNEAGRQLLPKALEVLDRIREIEAEGRDSAFSFDLRLGASLTIGNHLLPPLLADLKRRHSRNQIQLLLKNSEQVIADVLAYRIDIGFVEGPVKDERLRQFVWCHDRLSVFTYPDHPLAGKSATQEDIRNVSWVLREKGSGTREVFDRAVASATLSPRVDFEFEQPEAIRQCVRSKLGMGCLSIFELRDAFQAGWLAPVSTPFWNLERKFQIVMHRDKHLSRSIRTILAQCGINP